MFDEAVATSTARLATIVADAGVGKSRLTAEFLDRIADRVAARGRLPYGDGITPWPLAEARRRAAGIVNEDTGETALAASDGPGRRRGHRAVQAGDRDPARAVPDGACMGDAALSSSAAQNGRSLVVTSGGAARSSSSSSSCRRSTRRPYSSSCPARPTLLDQSPDFGNGERDANRGGAARDSASREMVESLLGGARSTPTSSTGVVTAASG